MSHELSVLEGCLLWESRVVIPIRIVFATYELPRKLITDNGPTFTSSEFRQFMEGNRIKHSTTSPYHPSSNGLTERVIQVIKQAVRSGKGGNVQEILSKFLFMYHITPHTTTGVPPSELLMGCCLRNLPPQEQLILRECIFVLWIKLGQYW